MSSHRAKEVLSVDNVDSSMDYLIRCSLYDSVAGAEPSPQVWERIHQRAEQNGGAVRVNTPAWYAPLSRRIFNLCLAVCFTKDLSPNEWHRVDLVQATAAETNLVNKWDLQYC